MKRTAYALLLRDIIHEQGAPETVSAHAVRLTDAQLADVLRYYDHVLPEVAAEIAESITACLDGNSSFAAMFASPAEAIGVALIAGCRDRIMRRVRLDLECTAADLETEDAQDAEYEHGVSA